MVPPQKPLAAVPTGADEATLAHIGTNFNPPEGPDLVTQVRPRLPQQDPSVLSAAQSAGASSGAFASRLASILVPLRIHGAIS